MSKTFLSIVNEVLLRVNEPKLTAANFSSAFALPDAVKVMVNDAVKDILAHRQYRWQFLRTNSEQNLVVGQQIYDLPSDHMNADWDSFWIPSTSDTDYIDLTFLDLHKYRTFRRRQDDANRQNNEYGKPRYIIDNGDGRYLVSTLPDTAYNLKYVYYKQPAEMVNHDDICPIPSAFSHLVKVRALYHLYEFRQNTEQQAQCESFYRREIKRMSQTYKLPVKTATVVG